MCMAVENFTRVEIKVKENKSISKDIKTILRVFATTLDVIRAIELS